MPYRRGSVTPAPDLLPIRKIVAVVIGAALARAAQALGIDLGPDLVNDAAMVLAGAALGYATRDVRVRPVKSHPVAGS